MVLVGGAGAVNEAHITHCPPFNGSTETSLRAGECFNSRQGQWCYSFRHCVQTGSGAHPVSYPMGIGASYPRGKSSRGAPPPSAQIKNAWSWTSTPPYVSIEWCLVKTDWYTVRYPMLSAFYLNVRLQLCTWNFIFRFVLNSSKVVPVLN